MNKEVYQIDSNGYFIKPIWIDENQSLPNNCVLVRPTEGLFKAQFFNGAWVENLSQSEIEAIKNAPAPPSELDQLKKQQTDLVFELMMKGVL